MSNDNKAVANGMNIEYKYKPDYLPRLVAADIEEAIIEEQYHHFKGTNHTVCCLTLRNGFTVIGGSCSVHDADFDAELGRRYAREEAFKHAWDHEAYMLKQRMFVFGK